MKSFLALTLLALLVTNVQAEFVLTHSYESDAGLGAGVHAGHQPTDMNATGKFGDQDPNFHFGVVVDSSLARTGDVAYFTDLGNLQDPELGGTNSSGFGGNFSVSIYNVPVGTFDTNWVFTTSAWVAENPNDMVTGGRGNLHFEFYDGNGQIVFRNDSFGQASGFPTGNDNGDAIPDYAFVSNTLSFIDVIGRNAHPNSAQGSTPITLSTLQSIASARAVVTGENAGNTGGGQFFIDDFQFTAAVPEPSTAVTFGILLGVFVMKRKKR